MKPVQIGFAPFLEVNAATFDLYFYDHDRDMIMDMVIKKISKKHFDTKSGTIM